MLFVLVYSFLLGAQTGNGGWYPKVDHTGYINKRGQEMQTPFNIGMASAFADGYARIYIDQGNGKLSDAIIDTRGEIVFKLNEHGFENISLISEGLFQAKVGDKFGYINKERKWVLEPAYDITSAFKDGRAIVKQDDRYLLIDKTGKVYPYSDDLSVGSFSDERAIVSYDNSIGDPDQLNGYVDTNGDLAIPIQYVNVTPFSEGVAAVQEISNGAWFFIDKNGRQVDRIPGAHFYTPFSSKLAGVEKNSKAGFINHRGKTVIPCKYHLVTPFTGDYAAVTMYEPLLTKFGKSFADYPAGYIANGQAMFAIINKKGDLVTGYDFYRRVMILEGGVAYVYIPTGNGKMYMALIDLDKGGKIIDRGTREMDMR